METNICLILVLARKKVTKQIRPMKVQAIATEIWFLWMLYTVNPARMRTPNMAAKFSSTYLMRWSDMLNPDCLEYLPEVAIFNNECRIRFFIFFNLSIYSISIPKVYQKTKNSIRYRQGRFSKKAAHRILYIDISSVLTTIVSAKNQDNLRGINGEFA